MIYSDELGYVYASKFKFGIRHHLRSLCEIERCSNILFLYLNSPAKANGASLLWDANENGEVCANTRMLFYFVNIFFEYIHVLPNEINRQIKILFHLLSINLT